MDILKEYVKSEREFINWFCEYYKHHISAFEEAPFDKQCEVIWRFLGYPVGTADQLSITELELNTRKYLYIYESLLIKYPDGIQDAIKILNRMSPTERKNQYPGMDDPRDILHSINEAVVDREKYAIVFKPMPSLSGALKALKNIILAKQPVVDDNFWDCILPNKRKNETVPF